MKKTIGIVAPIIGGAHYHVDFTLRLARNQRELTLKTLYELAQNGYRVEKIGRGFQYEEMGTAAGYYLSTILRQQGYQTMLTTRYDDEALQQLADADPFVVCLSTTMIIDQASLTMIAYRIRQYVPDALLIAGGVYIWKSHYTSRMQQGRIEQQDDTLPTLFQSKSSDLGINIFVTAPHGRKALLQAVQEAERGRLADFTRIPNLAIPNGDGTFSFTPIEEEEVDYNSDYTRWDLLDDLPKQIPLRTSIGCPFRCRFCSFCHLYPRIFLRSKESLLEELSLIKNRSDSHPPVVYITDDNTFMNTQRVHDVCVAMLKTGIAGWQGFVRASSVTPANISVIRQSGLFAGLIGVESGDPGQLERMNKAQRVEDVKQGIELLDQHGIAALMSFLIGFPGETTETVDHTIHFLNQLALGKSGSTYSLYPLSILPLSELAAGTFREQWKISGSGGVWSHATMNSEEAVEACYRIFKQVSNVPFHYLEKSYLFDRQVFTQTQRLKLYALRQKLTVQLLEQVAWPTIAATLTEISDTMGFPQQNIPASFRHEIVVPMRQGVNV